MFVQKDKNARRDLYLSERSIIIFPPEARYDWTHGMEREEGNLRYVSLPIVATDLQLVTKFPRT